MDLIPFLVEVAKTGQKDIPSLLNSFGHKGEEVVANYKERKAEKQREYRRHNESSFLGRREQQAIEPEGPPRPVTVSKSKGLSAKDIAGAEAPRPSQADAGGVAGWWGKRREAKEEEEQLKRQKWQEVMEKRQAGRG